MVLGSVSQAIYSSRWTTVFCVVLAGGTIVACLCPLRTVAPSNAAHRAHDPRPSSQRGPRLRQVYPTKDESEEDEPSTDIDIIAIHGLDTNSDKTWTWRGKDRDVNWLADSDMLPSRVQRVRIFTYDWPADLLQPSDLVQKTQAEFATLLFEEIHSSRIQSDPDRPILFIASCLGGIILMKALVGAGSTYQSVRRATRGIVFLATPFRGTSFQDVAAFAEPGLNAWAWIRGKEVIKLLTITKEPTLDLVQLVQDFSSLCGDEDYPCRVTTFYEKGKTSLPSKIFPWLPAWLRQDKLLVDHSSAALDIAQELLPLSRPHILMNKFAHSKCTAECEKSCTETEDFNRVSNKIVAMLQEIREGSVLEQADAWIRTKHYSIERLRIERLSGDLLPLDRCYINLTIVKELSKNGSGGALSSNTSPFSLAARLKVETPNKSIQVELPSLFDPRQDSNGQTLNPRRILIRGRAGVGKTTLCKKIVHEFINGTWSQWRELFDRVLWVPLRRLKEWSPREYNLEALFSQEYFAQKNSETCKSLAKELHRVVEKRRTLFILDGLDEIAQELSHGNFKSDFLANLLDQPNAIITSRPHVSLPANVSAPDLELETIGFYPDQVRAYLQVAFTDQKSVAARKSGTDQESVTKQKVEDILAYLESHQLVQGLVRIPIQLDALCYTWESFKGKAVPQTMTAMYKAIEESLWKKDIVRLGKLTKHELADMDMDEIEPLIRAEISFLEDIAFTGLHNDVINFGPEHRKAISKRLDSPSKQIFWATTLPRLSFVRTSEPSEDDDKRYYHFLHLTFQEYFAARYFVRQWRAEQDLNCLQISTEEWHTSQVKPTTFLQDHKYDPRYDIFWRFVAGLLDGTCKALVFFQEVEKEPYDILGPTHQRLVMHCLSETDRQDETFTEFRRKLESKLEQWLCFEFNSIGTWKLATEMECPPQLLVNLLNQASQRIRADFLFELVCRGTLPSSVTDLAISWLENDISEDLYLTILMIIEKRPQTLPYAILKRISAWLRHKDPSVRSETIKALEGQANLTEEIQHSLTKTAVEDEDRSSEEVFTEEDVQFLAAPLEDEDLSVQETAFSVLSDQSNLPEVVLQVIAEGIEHEDNYIQLLALKALRGQASLTDEVLQRIATRINDENELVQLEALKLLHGQTSFTEEMLQFIIAQLGHTDLYVGMELLMILRRQTTCNPTREMLKCILPWIEKSNSVPGFLASDALRVLLDQPALSCEDLSPHAEIFYKLSLQRSIFEHLYWSSPSFIGVDLRYISLYGEQQDQFRAKIWEIRKKMGVPLPIFEDLACR